MGSGSMSAKKVGLLLVIFLIAAPISRARTKEAVNFKYQLETGMQFGYRLTVKTTTIQKVLGMAINRDEEWQIRYQITVLSGSNNRGGALLRANYAAIAYHLDSPFQQYSYRLNPDDTTLPDRLKPFAKLIGTDFKLSLQKAPKIMVNTQKDNPVNPEKFDLQQLLESFSSDTLAAQYMFPKLINNIFWIYPKGAQTYKSNDSWQGVSSLTNGQFEPNVKTEYRIKDIDDERILVALATPDGCKYQKVEPVKDEKTELTKVVTALAGSLAGQVEIAKKSKLPSAGMLHLNLNGTVNRFGTDTPVTLKMLVKYQRF
jgi:hypothetical protein